MRFKQIMVANTSAINVISNVTKIQHQEINCRYEIEYDN